MNTLFDFTTHIKGVEYLMAIAAIVLYMVYWEVLKPRPFKTMMKQGKEDMKYMKESGSTVKTLGKVAAAPFIGIAYVVALPFAFAYGLAKAAIEGMVEVVGREAVFGWRPLEAYLAGRKRRKRKESETKKDEKK